METCICSLRFPVVFPRVKDSVVILTWNVPSLEVLQPCGTKKESDAGKLSGPALPGGRVLGGSLWQAWVVSQPESSWSSPLLTLVLEAVSSLQHRREMQEYLTMTWDLQKNVKSEHGSNIRKNAAVGSPKDHSWYPLDAIYCVGANHLG